MNKRTARTGIGAIVLVLLCILAACALRPEEQKEKQEKSKNEDSVQKYSFRDVQGNEYEAELVADVPLCNYDFSRLAEDGGYRYLADESGKKISRLGIDVSEYQKQIDWEQVKNAGIEFVMVRVGYRGYGAEGKLVEDAMFRRHIEGALGAGLKAGAYFFSQAVSEAEALEEAEFVLNIVKDYDISYPVVYDTEEIKNDEARTDHLDAGQFTDHCIVFCDAVKNAGYDAMIYANMKWMAFTLELERLKEYDKWYADYEPVPQCPYHFQMWQYTETGSVPGIEGNVDINVMFPDQ